MTEEPRADADELSAAGNLRADGGANVAHDRVDAGGLARLALANRDDDQVRDRGEGGAYPGARGGAPEDHEPD